jgi:CheY-like chemotaxis protein
MAEVPRSPLEGARPALGPERPVLAGRRVLLVEDVPSQQRMLAARLARAGAEVVLECNGQSAVEEVFPRRGTPPTFDAVVMDLMMSPMDGVEATVTLRRGGFGAPVLIMTASDDPADESRCAAAGCDRFLRKSAGPEALVGALAEFLTGEARRG